MERKMEEVKYTRCPKCGFIYDNTNCKCPNCDNDTIISEDTKDEKVFNICD